MRPKCVKTLLWLSLLAGMFNPFRSQAEPLSRQDAIEMALTANPDVTAARKMWEAARARTTQARALPDPEVGAEYEQFSVLTGPDAFGERNLGVTQTVENPLKWWRRGRAAAEAAQAVRLAALEMTQLETRTRVAVAYDRVLFAQKRLGYIQQDLLLAQDFRRKAQLRLEAGDVPQLEVLRAEVEAGRVANRLAAGRSDLAVAWAALNTLLARKERTPLELSDELEYEPVPVELEELRRWGLKRRPDVQAAGWALRSARSTQGVARAALLPDLSLGLFRQTIREPVDTDDYWRVALTLEFPLWGAARQRGRLAEARADAGQAAARQSSTRYRVLLEIESAFLDMRTAEEQVRLFQERIMREAERSFEVARRSYTEGKASYLELLAAQRALAEVREEYAAALFNYRSALAALERASGGDLSGQ